MTKLLQTLQRSIHYSTRLRNSVVESPISTSPRPNYAFYDSFPEYEANQSRVFQTIKNTKNQEQVIKISQIIESPSPESETNNAELRVHKNPKFSRPRNLISIADYFSGNSHHLHHVFYSSLMAAKSRRAQRIENRKFIDLKIVKMTTGAGGNGCVSFFKDNWKSQGPADGGDGGSGGDIYINVVDRGTNSLHNLNKKYVATSGSPGKGGQLDGKNGEDIVIDIPLGTIIRWIPDPQIFKKYVSQKEGDPLDNVFIELELRRQRQQHHYHQDLYGMEEEGDDYMIQLNRDSYEPGSGWNFKKHEMEYYYAKSFFKSLNKRVTEYDEAMRYEERQQDQFPLFGLDCDKVTTRPELFLRGGKGGLGNMHFITTDVRNPNFCKIGRSGISAHFLLELKLIADLGLVGLPNAGKSSLLRAISKAKPRVGHWEFTTLQPTIGTIQHRIDSDPFTVADIPGIIKGASNNKGMGLDFLRHIERSGGLVFVVSLESEDPSRDLQTLIDEVGHKRMKDKKVLVVATKADLSNQGENFQRLKDFLQEKHREWKIVPVCAPRGENIECCVELMNEVAKK
ncbi:MTG2 [Candida oxycetoniae]|uniref:MTG2 n=1 Tax=Candida oxycetoniae TaxID=497107 RepID=A0AAI9SYB2_9ASCO|nr:MTG2 [Candida oxycetoniae]KAI3404992.2 MTG2 [Candida oxycetoniae]